MASRLLRLSGVNVALVTETLDNWKADLFIQVGVGVNHKEIEVLIEEWGLTHNQIICFEASPLICKDIRSKFPGVLVEVAVSDEADQLLPFYCKTKHADGSSLYSYVKDEKVKVCSVKTNTLDNMMVDQGFDLSQRVLLWIDCEGHELKALKGAEELVKDVDVINIEMTMNPPGVGWCDSTEVHEWLTDHGFFRQWIHTHRIHSGQHDAFYVKPEIFKPEFCCCPYTIKEWRQWVKTTK